MVDPLRKTFLQESWAAAALVVLPMQDTAAVARDTESLVSFESSYTEVPVGVLYAGVRLRRFEAGERPLGVLTVAVRATGSVVGDGSTGMEVVFPAGSGEGECNVPIPTVQSGTGELVLVLEIVSGEGAKAFGRKWHVVRRKAGAERVAGNRINGVVFSGAGNPADAVEGTEAGVVVEGGIVALGGGGGGRAQAPAVLVPRREYASGEWVPPLSPLALVIEFGIWRWNAVR